LDAGSTPAISTNPVNAAGSSRSPRRFAYIAPVTDEEARELIRQTLEEHRERVAAADLAPDEEPDHARAEDAG
jgi:hypothetical protein